MRRILIIVSLLVFPLLAMAQQKKPRVAVYMTGNDPVNEIISNRLMSDLLSGGKYTPVERSAAFLQLVSKEQSYQHSGEVDDDQIAALGKQLGLEYVCVVSVVDVWQNEKYITAHIIDVNSAEVVDSCSSNGTLTNAQQMMSALDDLSRNLTKALDYSKQSSTTKVAVYVTRSGNKDVDIILADQLVAAFSRSGKYVAVERTSSFLKQLSKEVGYQQSGAVDDNDMIAELGKKFGVQYVCVAKTSSLFGAYFITARLVNVENAQVLKMYNAENKAINNSQDVLKVTQEIANKLIETSANSSNSGNGGTTTQRGQDFIETALGINMKMVYVEGGTFTMGCTGDQGNDCESDESPDRMTTVSSFYIGMLEVTQSQWEKVMGRNPLQEEINKEKSELDNMKKEIAKIEERITLMNQVIASYRYQIQTTKRKQEIESYAKNIALSSAELEGLVDDLEKEKKKYQDKSNVVYKKESMVDANKPIYYVSWEEAKEFCARLSRQTGRNYSLPTEAEWEYAARGGKKNEGTKYAGGWSIDDVAWYSGNSNSSTHMCGTKRPNALGLYDMSGNVWEWCEDWYGSQYLQYDNNNPKGASTGSNRVLRGGSWYDDALYSRVARRSDNSPGYRDYGIGFRVVLH